MLITPRSTISKAAMRSWRVMAIKMVAPTHRHHGPALGEIGIPN
jgi:hypothetical protein